MNKFLDAHKLIHNVALTSLTNLKADPSLPFSAKEIKNSVNSDNLIAFIICYNYHGNIYYTIASDPDFDPEDFDELAEIVSEDIFSSSLPLKSISLGDSKLSNLILNKINSKLEYSKKANLFIDMNLFQLRPSDLKKSFLELPSGFSFRLADQKDIDIVADYTMEFLKELNMAENSTDINKIKSMAQELIGRQQRYLILDKNSNPASFGGIRIILPRIYSVGPIYTPKDYRKKGYEVLKLSFIIQFDLFIKFQTEKQRQKFNLLIFCLVFTCYFIVVRSRYFVIIY